MCRLIALMLAGICLANTAQAQDTPQEPAPEQGERRLWLEPLGTVAGILFTARGPASDLYTDERLCRFRNRSRGSAPLLHHWLEEEA